MIKNLEDKISKLIDTTQTNAWLHARLDKGAVLLGILPNSPAEKSGFKKGDIILSINNKPILSLNDYLEYMSSNLQNQPIKFDIIRNNKYISLYYLTDIKN